MHIPCGNKLGFDEISSNTEHPENFSVQCWSWISDLIPHSLKCYVACTVWAGGVLQRTYPAVHGSSHFSEPIGHSFQRLAAQPQSQSHNYALTSASFDADPLSLPILHSCDAVQLQYSYVFRSRQRFRLYQSKEFVGMQLCYASLLCSWERNGMQRKKS